jgi:1-acyl-sn-glycerol-3-phosphate acyltransferase
MCKQVLRTGWPLIFFPEGTRAKDGKLGAIQGGMGMILEGLNVPYVPIVMQDTFEVMPKGAWFPRPVKVRIVIGEPALPSRREEGEPMRAWLGRLAADLERRYRELGAE